MSGKAMISVFGLLLLSTSLHGLVISASAQPPNNPDELIVATIGEPETVDPAWCYDTGSAGLIFNVYDTLIRFEGEYSAREDY